MIYIKVNWLDEKSIKKAEKTKSYFENRGYKLIKTINSGNNAELVYDN